jgi:MaoC like domain
VSTASIEVGTAEDLYEGRIDADASVAYALATNDVNDLYLQDIAVPPLYTATLILPAAMAALHQGMGRRVIKRARGSVHGQHDVYFWGEVRPGMALRWDGATHSITQTPGGVIEAQRILVTDLDGAPLVEHFWSTFHMGGRVAADIGPGLTDHSFPPAAQTRWLGNQTISVDRDQAFRYAGVSGDHAGHATDDEIARREGYPSKILQGMCTFGLCSGAVVNLAAGGDPRRLRRLAGRFSSPAFPRRDLVVDLFDAGRTEEGGRAMAFEAKQGEVTVIKHGRVELLPD